MGWDWVGYIGSCIVFASFLMKEMTMLRWMNLLGCGIFIVYGALIHSLPIVITNSLIVLVNLWFLFFKKKDESAQVEN